MPVIRVKTSSPQADGWLEIDVAAIVCYGRPDASPQETVWLSSGLAVGVVDGTCELIRKTLAKQVHSCVPAPEQPEPSHSVTAEGLVRMPDGTPGVKMKNDWEAR